LIIPLLMVAFQMLSDDELVALLKQRDEVAFREVYERYDSLLYVYAHRKLGDKLEAQDSGAVLYVLEGLFYDAGENFKLQDDHLLLLHYLEHSPFMRRR